MQLSFKKSISIAGLLITGLAGQQTAMAATTGNEKPAKPNFVVIFCDDLGYGDLGVFGHPTIKTPNLDKMAHEGQKWTNFYVAAPVCTPSRAGLLTGRLPIRSGMCSDKRRVLFPDSNGGIPQSEITIAEALKENGYRTAAIGKWHLGHKTQYLPTNNGFDSYYGIPYSNDMDKVEKTNYFTLAEQEKFEAYNVPLMRDEEIVERPADQRTLTKRYTEEAVKKIRQLKDEPFFLYLAQSFPHIPLFRSEKFKDSSLAGIYGDVIEEIDWSVGEVIKAINKEGIASRTLVVFTSDNGPWHTFKTHGGSAGPLRGAKGGTFEGGMREPTIFWWPGALRPGVVMDMATSMDLLPTFCSLSNTNLPDDRIYDGYDISPLLFGTGSSPRDVVFYYRGVKVYAIRKGSYKAHFITQQEYGTKTAHPVTVPEVQMEKTPTIQDPPLLYNINVDPGEKYNIAEDHPGIIDEIRKIMEQHVNSIEPVENQLEK
jgi:arylsulfatase A